MTDAVMNEPGLVTIRMNELQRVKVIEAVVEGRVSGIRALGSWGGRGSGCCTSGFGPTRQAEGGFYVAVPAAKIFSRQSQDARAIRVRSLRP